MGLNSKSKERKNRLSNVQTNWNQLDAKLGNIKKKISKKLINTLNNSWMK